jgi:Methyltransferase domain
VLGGFALYQELLFPGVLCDNWQMMDQDRMALTGVLARIRPQGALEVGVYHGGSLSLTAQFAKHIIAIDIDPAVKDRFKVPGNVELLIGDSRDLIPRALARFDKLGIPLEYVLIDADHSAAGVRRDLDLVLQYRPKKPMVILAHDSGNPDCRAGILAADWHANPYVRYVQCDFVTGQITEHEIRNGQATVWGGFALAYLDPQPRSSDLVISQGAITMVRGLHHLGKDLSVIGN